MDEKRTLPDGWTYLLDLIEAHAPRGYGNSKAHMYNLSRKLRDQLTIMYSNEGKTPENAAEEIKRNWVDIFQSPESHRGAIGLSPEAVRWLENLMYKSKERGR